MSPEPVTILAITIIFDSSISLGQQWPKPLLGYLTSVLRRLTDAHTPARLRLAFVGYGTADTVPSPIITKRFFIENPLLLKEALEFPHNLGIGTTSSGGSRGMAILDGLVAVLELFDGLTNLPNTKVAGSYIVHFCAGHADNSNKPSYNDNIMMDDISWESLPSEMKKRNVNYNVLAMGGIQGRLSNFYSEMNGNITPSKPWFELQPQYHLFAASIISLEMKGSHTKRPSETAATVDRTPDNKRPRLQGNTESPKTTPKTLATPPQSQPQSATPSQSKSQATIQPQPLKQPSQTMTGGQAQPAAPGAQTAPSNTTNLASMVRFPAHITAADAYQKLAQVDAYIQKLRVDLETAKQSQNSEAIERITHDISGKMEFHSKMKTLMDARFKQLPDVAQPPQVVHPNNLSNNSLAGQPSPNMAGLDTAPPQAQHARTMSAASLPSTTPTLPPSIPPANPQAISVQMQKMIDQKNRATPNAPIPGIQPPSHPNSSNTDSSPFNPSTGPQVNPSGQPSTQAHIEWNGVLKWSGTGPTGKKEMQCAVSLASILNAPKSQIETWPSVMVLIPAPEQFSLNDMHEYIKSHQPCIALFRPATNDGETRSSYMALMQLLSTKRIYATSSWPNPSGQVTRNIIFFPHNQHNILAGAVFPETGLPALPKPMPTAPPTAPTIPPALAHLPPQTINALRNMPPEQRQMFLARIMQQNIAQKQQEAAAAQLQSQTEANAGVSQQSMGQSNFTTALNMMATNPAFSPNPMNNMNMPQMTTSLPNRMPNTGNPTNIPGNFSYEMLQSFMQRNGGDASGMNLGPKG